jgi:hypothetical protein
MSPTLLSVTPKSAPENMDLRRFFIKSIGKRAYRYLYALMQYMIICISQVEGCIVSDQRVMIRLTEMHMMVAGLAACADASVLAHRLPPTSLIVVPYTVDTPITAAAQQEIAQL